MSKWVFLSFFNLRSPCLGLLPSFKQAGLKICEIAYRALPSRLILPQKKFSCAALRVVLRPSSLHSLSSALVSNLAKSCNKLLPLIMYQPTTTIVGHENYRLFMIRDGEKMSGKQHKITVYTCRFAPYILTVQLYSHLIKI